MSNSDSGGLTPVEPGRLEQDIRKSFEDFESEFRRQHPYLWASTLLLPLVSSIAILAVIGIVAGPAYAGKVASVAIATFLFVGRFVILAGHSSDSDVVGRFLTSEQLFAMVTYMDAATALLVAFHTGVLFRLPGVGPRISGLVADGRFVLKRHPWMRRATFLGLSIFVAFPLAATGSVGGSILGRLLGMSRLATFLATITGCLFGNTVMYLASDAISLWVDKNHPVIKYGGVVMIILVVSLLEWRYRSMKQHDLTDPNARNL